MNLKALFYLPLLLYLTGCVNPADRELEKELVFRYNQRQGKPYEWKAKQLRRCWYQLLRSDLLKKDNGSPAEMRGHLKQLLAEIELGKNWPEPREIAIPHCRRAPVIDGRIDEEEWQEALTFRGEYGLNRREREENDSVWRIMYDSQWIYFSAEFTDPDIIVSTEHPYYHDSLELFLEPDPRLQTYVELVLPPGPPPHTTLCHYSHGEAFQFKVYEFPSLDVRTKITPGGFLVEGKIGFRDLPGYFLGNEAKAGEHLNFMFVRTRKDGTHFSIATPEPLLYDGHNTFGYLRGYLQPTITGESN